MQIIHGDHSLYCTILPRKTKINMQIIHGEHSLYCTTLPRKTKINIQIILGDDSLYCTILPCKTNFHRIFVAEYLGTSRFVSLIVIIALRLSLSFNKAQSLVQPKTVISILRYLATRFGPSEDYQQSFASTQF